PVEVIKLLRPKQWTKNLLVFAAPLFTGGITKIEVVVPALLAFAALCLASSSIYVVNDLLDVERDRLHPKKCKRPIASGAVPVWLATLCAPLLVLGALLLAWQTSLSATVLIGCYVALHSIYNLGMKHTAVADVF